MVHYLLNLVKCVVVYCVESIMKKGKQKTKLLILDNIRSAYNVGSLFRTADAAGVSKIYLVGITPGPVDRFGRKRLDIQKSALGAEDSVSWEHSKNMKQLLLKLKAEGVFVVALEQSPQSISYKKLTVEYPVAFIVGNEVCGVSRSALQQSDAIAEIPMRGKKESLNVTVAAGVVLFNTG